MGPLASLRIVEFEGLGPAPFAAMTLSDLGARVTRITRAGARTRPPTFLNRGRDDVPLDLKTEAGIIDAMALIAEADVLVEGFRPGKMESLGLGPADCAGLNPKLVYARMTGWGQAGPLAHLGGHDINYLGLSGVLSLLGEPDRPPRAPLNLISDFGGGGMYLALGILAAVMQARETGTGCIVDAAMVHGTAHLASMPQAWMADGRFRGGRGDNVLDGGAPFYRCYVTADGGYMAVGALEPVFFRALVEALDLDRAYLDGQNDRSLWPLIEADIAERFAGRNRDHWTAVFREIDACVSPVLSMAEAQAHPQMQDVFAMRDGVLQPTPAPRILPLA